jgi:hypothetical protein
VAAVPRPGGDLLPVQADDVQAGGGERERLVVVAAHRGARAVELEAVELDREAVGGPEGVDLVAGHIGVDERGRVDVVLADQPHEDPLEL